MNTPTISIEGRRCYVTTQYGHPCIAKLKSLGAHWEPESKRWWISSAKKADVERVISSTNEQSTPNVASEDIKVIGKAKYKGRNYYVRWVGNCKDGSYKARLCTLDGKIDFWAAASQDWNYTGNDLIAKVIKTFEESRSLSSIRRYVESLKKQESQGNSKPDEECYLRGEEWLVKGCSACANLGRMCKTCEFDIYDN